MEHVHAIVSFSPDVNSVELSSNPFINWFLQKKASRWNRRNLKEQLYKMALSCGINGMTILQGNGLYVDEKQRRQKERSVQLDILFTNAYSVEKLARELCTVFKQEAVLVRYVEYPEIRQIGEHGDIQ